MSAAGVVFWALTMAACCVIIVRVGITAPSFALVVAITVLAAIVVLGAMTGAAQRSTQLGDRKRSDG